MELIGYLVAAAGFAFAGVCGFMQFSCIQREQRKAAAEWAGRGTVSASVSLVLLLLVNLMLV